MKTLDELYRNLEKYKDFDENDNNCIKFLETVDEIVLKKDPSSIPVLLSYFDDESEYSWVLTSLRKAIECFDQEIYIQSIIQNIHTLIIKSPIWSDEIINVILNAKEDALFFRMHMHLADKESLLKLFDIMEKESPHHAPLIQELRRELLKNP